MKTDATSPRRHSRNSALLLIIILGAVLFGCSSQKDENGGSREPVPFSTLDSGRFALTVRFQVKPNQIPPFRDLMVERIAEVRAHPAAVDIRLFETETPNVFLVFESFSSRGAWEAFSNEPHSKEFIAAARLLQEAPFQLQFLNLVKPTATGSSKVSQR